MLRRAALQTMLSQHLSSIAIARHHAQENSDPESLHDLRVAIRGLRAILPLLGKKNALFNLRTQWRTLAQSTSDCRDLEVLLELLPLLPSVPEAIHAQLVTAEHEARNKLCLLLASAELPLLLQYSRKTLSTLLAPQPSQAIRQRTQRRAIKLAKSIHQQIPNLGREASAGDWHVLRLTIKRLRYLIEHGQNWLPKHWRELHPSLKHSQTALGDLHDLDMLVDRTKLNTGTLHDIRRAAACNSVTSLLGDIGVRKIHHRL